MQSAYAGKLMELAEQNHDVIQLLADSGDGYTELFRRSFPDQLYNFGISEGNMIAAAAGMATVGKIPFIFAQGAFLVYRALEFIRNDVCFQGMNVKMVGAGSGISISSLGPTHHTTEDIAVLRALPNLMILSPASPRQVAECVNLAYQYRGPVYIRIGMNREKEFFDGNYQLDERKNDIITDGTDVAVYVTGSILEEAVDAAEMLRRDGISAKVIHVCTIKPFPNDLKENAGMKRIFSVEEHNIHGGLGSILAEAVAYQGLGVQVRPIGLPDIFAEGYGTCKAVRAANGLDAKGIYQKIKEELYE